MSDVNIQVSQEVVKPIIEAKIQAAVIAELDKMPILVKELVDRMLSTKVNSEGKPDRYDAKMTLLEWVVNGELRTLCTEVIKEMVKGRRDILKKEFEKTIIKNKGGLAECFLNNLANNAYVLGFHRRQKGGGERCHSLKSLSS